MIRVISFGHPQRDVLAEKTEKYHQNTDTREKDPPVEILEKEDDKLKASMAFEKALVITYGNYGATPAAKELLGAAARCALEAGYKDRSDELLKKWQPLVMI